MEEIVLDAGRIRHPSFTDYLIPTAPDVPPVLQSWIEQPEPGAPFGAKGVGEPPTISSTPAIVAAIRDATGLPIRRVRVRPQDVSFDGPPGWTVNRLVLRGARHPGDIAIEDGRIGAVGKLPAQPGDRVQRIDG